jgi:hypothetical protein
MGFASLYPSYSAPHADYRLQPLQRLGYTRRLFESSSLRVLPTMEINPILNSIKDLSERSETIRGYL